MPEHGKPFVPDRHTYSLIRSSRILSLGEKILLEEIVYRCGRKDHCWPSKSTLAEGVGTDRGTISRRLKKLEEKGLIRRVESDLSTKKTYIIWSDGIYRGWGRCALSSEGAVHSG